MRPLTLLLFAGVHVRVYRLKRWLQFVNQQGGIASKYGAVVAAITQPAGGRDWCARLFLQQMQSIVYVSSAVTHGQLLVRPGAANCPHPGDNLCCAVRKRVQNPNSIYAAPQQSHINCLRPAPVVLLQPTKKLKVPARSSRRVQAAAYKLKPEVFLKNAAADGAESSWAVSPKRTPVPRAIFAAQRGALQMYTICVGM